MVDYGKVLSKSLKFAFSPRRWLQFFILDLIFFSILFAAFFNSLTEIVAMIVSMSTAPATVLSFMGLLAGLFIVIAIYGLLKLWITGAIIRQSYKENEKMKKTFMFSKSRYLSLLASSIIVGIIVVIVSMIPFIGAFLAIIASWVFFFFIQSVVISKYNFHKSISNSYNIFVKKPLHVIIMWIIVTIISAIIAIVFALPIVVEVFALVGGFSGLLSATGMSMALVYLMNNVHILFILALIYLIGNSIATTFQLKAGAEFYLELNKKLKFFKIFR